MRDTVEIARPKATIIKKKARPKAAIIKKIIYFKILETRGSYQIKCTKLYNDFNISRNVKYCSVVKYYKQKECFFLNCGYYAWKFEWLGGGLGVLAKIEKYQGTYCGMVVPVWKIPFFQKVPAKEDKVF